MKRLRKKFSNKTITFFHVGEYGEKTHRPHHHAIIFGENFEDDRIEIEKSKSGKIQYWSKTLSDLWACGRVSVQDLNPANAVYISQYSLKKFKNNELNKRYKTIMSFSNKNKMNAKWVRRNHKEIIKGYLTDIDGKKYKIPKSYIENLKNSKEKKYRETFEQYENNLIERMSNMSNSDIIENQKRREIAILCKEKNMNKCRDF